VLARGVTALINGHPSASSVSGVVSVKKMAGMKHVARAATRCAYAARPYLLYSLARVPPSMLQGLASRNHSALTRHIHHLGRLNALLLSRPAPPLVSGVGHSCAPAVLTARRRHYAQQTPPGGGRGGSGGIPGLSFPMQQQYAKGDALKEFVRCTSTTFLPLSSFLFIYLYIR
jgi:hypothetical protein